MGGKVTLGLEVALATRHKTILVFSGLLFVRAPFCVWLFCICMCSACFVLVKLSILAKCLARKTPLRKPNCGEGIISTKPRPKSVYDFLGSVYGFVFPSML